jgi:hypothetical protein
MMNHRMPLIDHNERPNAAEVPANVGQTPATAQYPVQLSLRQVFYLFLMLMRRIRESIITSYCLTTAIASDRRERSNLHFHYMCVCSISRSAADRGIRACALEYDAIQLYA